MHCPRCGKEIGKCPHCNSSLPPSTNVKAVDLAKDLIEGGGLDLVTRILSRHVPKKYFDEVLKLAEESVRADLARRSAETLNVLNEALNALALSLGGAQR